MTKHYREDTRNLVDLLSDIQASAKDLVESAVLLVTRILCVPILLAIKVWLPQLPENERVRREVAAKEWADADI